MAYHHAEKGREHNDRVTENKLRKPAKRFLLSVLALLLIGVLMACSGTAPKTSEKAKQTAAASAAPIDLQLLAITDFHGYLQPLLDRANSQINTPDGLIRVGGAAYNAAHLKKLKAGHGNSMLLSVGDNFSGWPFEVDAFKNEPTVEFLNKIGVDVSVAGNHEFDVSSDFLVNHMMKGQCFGRTDVDSCYKDSAGKPFHGTDFEYISANVHDAQTGKLVLKPYVIRKVSDGHGGTVPVGIIGLTEAGTFTNESMSVQAGRLDVDAAPDMAAGLPFDPMARALIGPANQYAKELQDQGVETIIVLLHEGGKQSGPYNGCFNPSGPAFDFAKYASPAIDVILTGHWHEAFNCSIPDPAGNPRPVVEGANHGKLITEINLKIDPATKDVIRDQTVANNRLVTRDIEPDPEVSNMVSYWVQRGKEKWGEPLAFITSGLTRVRNKAGESLLADVIADAFYAAGKTDDSKPTDFALTSGDAMKDLYFGKGDNAADRDGLVTFGELSEANGTLTSEVAVTLTREQIDRIFEEQWKKNPDGTDNFNPLNVSYNVRYTYDRKKPIGQRIDPAQFFIDGKPLDPKKSYRVATTGVLVVSGKDTYPSFAGYTDAKRIAAWPVVDYFQNQGEIKPPELNRVQSAQ